MKKSKSSLDISSTSASPDFSYKQTFDQEWSRNRIIPHETDINNDSGGNTNTQTNTQRKNLVIGRILGADVWSDTDSSTESTSKISFFCSRCKRIMKTINDWYSLSNGKYDKHYMCSMECLWESTHDTKRDFSNSKNSSPRNSGRNSGGNNSNNNSPRVEIATSNITTSNISQSIPVSSIQLIGEVIEGEEDENADMNAFSKEQLSRVMNLYGLHNQTLVI